MRHIQHVWRNDITGLRAIAVLPVLLFHAFPALLPGGFFGVDVFFVISGYLISGIIFRSLRDDKFSYRIFYEKRIKRILPNLFLLLIAVSIVGYFYLIPEEYKKLGHHVYSSAVFLQNFRLLKSVGYFTEEALRQPLLHLWSLAIEEQFYIVFPILCSIIWKFSHRSIKTLGIFVFFITISSFSACLLAHDKNFSFYFPLTRFWELGVGILLAYNETFEGRGGGAESKICAGLPTRAVHCRTTLHCHTNAFLHRTFGASRNDYIAACFRRDVHHSSAPLCHH